MMDQTATTLIKVEIFSMHNFENYKMIKNPANIGTVNNYYQALLKVKGEYLYGISPGDMLYNKDALRNLYNFIIEKKQRYVLEMLFTII